MTQLAGIKDSKKNPPVAVLQPEDGDPVTTEILADAILRVSEGMIALRKSGLNKEAIVVLLVARTKISRRNVVTILDALADLKKWYCE